jgi:type II restriction/modification system DNA methylase subunit YeeA
VSLIGGTPFPRHVAAKRKRLEERIKRQGFEQVMEAMAYTWFNRLVAIRYMELHGYLDHGYRVLSHPEGKTIPEIIEHAEHVDLPGLDPHKVIELKLDGTKEAELYRMLLVAQCNALHRAMPFLFERINDETELLLPDNLLHSDSLIRKLVNSIDEEDWQEVEIIGWLYQFYISEKKDEVIGKVVKSEDIPAATQLFTPNWIVKYMVQNTLGRQWMATYPDSRLKEQMEFYIEPAVQTPEVQAQLREITPDSLNPEELTLLDPACGSGHILVEAYGLLKAIYQERGYRARDIPRLILEKNLYGLEIDDRAAQLAAFALMMKAREDDRRIFASGMQPHILAIQESKGLNAKEVTEALNAPLEYGEKQGQQGDIPQADVSHLIELFEHGKTFGSLIRVPKELAEKLPAIAERVQDVLHHGEMLEQPKARIMEPLVKQVQILAAKYDAIVANPPYMGGRYMNSALKTLARTEYPNSKSDLFAVSTERMLRFVKSQGHMGLMTPFVWMFLSSYESLRQVLVQDNCILSLIRPEYHAFFDSAYVPICTFIVLKHSTNYRGSFIDLSQFYGENEQPTRALEVILNPDREWRFEASSDDFKKIPGSPIAYWVSDKVRGCFEKSPRLDNYVIFRKGMVTADNDKYIRNWQEVNFNKAGWNFDSRDAAKESGKKWFPYVKGGEFRKWYGNNYYLVNWENDGFLLQTTKHHTDNRIAATNFNYDFIFKESGSYSSISSSKFSSRFTPTGFLYDQKGGPIFTESRESLISALSLLNSKVSEELMLILCPTLDFNPGSLEKIPFIKPFSNGPFKKIIAYAKSDWDSYETSWDFTSLPLLRSDFLQPTLKATYAQIRSHWQEVMLVMQRHEEENNRIFIDAYNLQDELTPSVPLKEITLTCNPYYRYGSDKREEELEAQLREDTLKELISYAVGCMMGRYSLDKPGLIYAHSGNQGFDSSQYQTFPADDDGIIPITDDDWFPDDAANREEAFIATAWPKEHLEENLKFIAESLGPNRNEQPRDTIRRYLGTGFYKHHLSTYKRRPIYWLFSSGKQRAFQCLVYLHRYNEGTLSRMRTEYVIPLQGKISSRIDQLKDDVDAATSTSHRKRLEKERDKLLKQQAELQTFDEQLRHYADRRISLDLDDGVKVNYAKFGDLLAEVKAVTGRTDGP